MKIEVENITARQKLTIAKGLCDYKYIMDYYRVNDSDFQDVYYNFYLKARWAVMNKPSNYNPYFNKLQNTSINEDLIQILEELKESMEKKDYEFSLGSKLLHTINPNKPIYDSKVRKYLGENEKVEFWWARSQRMYGSKAPNGTPEIEKIRHDYNALCLWCENLLNSDRGRRWISWFDENFPEYRDISDAKKIDFIIFACN